VLFSATCGRGRQLALPGSALHHGLNKIEGYELIPLKYS
jgi:hypothetical protein